MKILSGKELNEQNLNKTFYKYIQKNQHGFLINHDYVYQIGLNKITPFEHTDDCSKGGLYFSNIDHIQDYKSCGNTCFKISIPDDSIVLDLGDKYKTNKLVLIEECDIETELMKYIEELINDVIDEKEDKHILDQYCVVAARNNRIDILKLLIENGADVNNICDWSALMHATYNNRIDVVKLLIENGADVNYKSVKGWTVLMFATEYGFVEIAEFLIQNGADMNTESETGSTALTYALKNDEEKCVKLLIENGANVNTENKYGVDALTYAKSRNKEKCLKMLKMMMIKDEDEDDSENDNTSYKIHKTSCVMM